MQLISFYNCQLNANVEKIQESAIFSDRSATLKATCWSALSRSKELHSQNAAVIRKIAKYDRSWCCVELFMRQHSGYWFMNANHRLSIVSEMRTYFVPRYLRRARITQQEWEKIEEAEVIRTNYSVICLIVLWLYFLELILMKLLSVDSIY